jgi:predicted nucleotidyltransferase component of viral defense system
MNIFLNEIKKYDLGVDKLQELAASELLQKVILAGLSETDFFERAAFHGGTALRILYGLHRFSQDLDFSLIASVDNCLKIKLTRTLNNQFRSHGFQVLCSGLYVFPASVFFL